MVKNLLFLAGGLGLGYYIAKQTLEKEYADLAMQEIADAKKYYAGLAEKAQAVLKENVAADVVPVVELPKKREELRPAFAGISSAQAVEEVKAAANALKNYQGLSMGDKKAVDIVHEDEKRPTYVISAEEFMNNDNEWEQSTLTYYVGDDVLEGQDANVVDEIDVSVTRECLSKFGYDSGDPNVVYVRNEDLELEFEVCRNMGKYSVLVQGKPDVSTEPEVSADPA